MAVDAKRAGKPMMLGPLWARNWAKFGKAAERAQLGDILVFRRAQGGGHVGLYVGEDYFAFLVLGGNQSDGVTITRIARDHCITIRGPAYRKAPVTGKAVQLAANGVLSNEACLASALWCSGRRQRHGLGDRRSICPVRVEIAFANFKRRDF